jgi:hypothetical protein
VCYHHSKSETCRIFLRSASNVSSEDIAPNVHCAKCTMIKPNNPNDTDIEDYAGPQKIL